MTDPIATLSPSERTTVADYDEHAAQRQRGPEFWLPEVRQFNQLLATGRILEIGCGNGAEGGSFRDREYDYVGTDISTGYLAEARRLHPELDFRHMSVYDLGFDDSEFDGIWSGNTLYHLPKGRFEEALQEIHRVVRIGGLAFISLPVGTGEGMWAKRSFGYDSQRLWSRYNFNEAMDAFVRQGFRLQLLRHKQSNGSGDPREEITWMLFYLRTVA